MATGVLVLGRQPGHPAARPPDAHREGVRRHDPARGVDDDRRRRGRGRRDRPDRRASPSSGVRDALAAFVGEIDQVPTAVSAIKVDGKRAYARVRDGEEVDLPARPGDGPRARRSPTCRRRRRRTSRCAAPAAPTSAPSPATSAPRSASAGTSPRCGARPSGPFDLDGRPHPRRPRRRTRGAADRRRCPRDVPGGRPRRGAGRRRARRPSPRPGAPGRASTPCSRPTGRSSPSTQRPRTVPDRWPSSSADARAATCRRGDPEPSVGFAACRSGVPSTTCRPTSAARSSRSATSTACTSGTATCWREARATRRATSASTPSWR